MADIPVVVLGAGGVGKSCLTIQFVQGHFVDKYDATIEDVYRKPIDFDQQPAVLTIVDTAGQETFSSIRDHYLRKGQGFVLVYSITDWDSFQQTRKIYGQVQAMKVGQPIPCVLVANKMDQEAYRAVDTERGRQLASELSCPFVEATAKDRAMTEIVFRTLVEEIRKGGAAASASTSRTGPPPHSESDAKAAADGGSGETKTVKDATASDAAASVSAEKPQKRSGKHKKRRCTLL